MPALQRGEVVITDRFVDSLLAYQGGGRLLELAEVEHVARWATGDLRPHLTVVLDVEPEQGLSRFAERDRIEGEAPDFFVRAREAFLLLAGADPDHYLVVDADRPAEEIAEIVLTRVTPLLSQAAR
jgi:dTMP kinase